jgi:hypothetical protein
LHRCTGKNEVTVTVKTMGLLQDGAPPVM